jgi:hypothetical protein
MHSKSCDRVAIFNILVYHAGNTLQSGNIVIFEFTAKLFANLTLSHPKCSKALPNKNPHHLDVSGCL